jgi:glucose/arabinose dehydrogenase/mono/diheme cytochrome c family protein
MSSLFAACGSDGPLFGGASGASSSGAGGQGAFGEGGQGAEAGSGGAGGEGASGQGGDGGQGAGFGYDARPPNPTCLAHDKPPSSDVAGLQRAYSADFAGPTSAAFSPTDPTRLYVTEKRGTLRWALPADLAPTTALDLTDVAETSLDMGLVAVAFDPGYAQSHAIYLVYNVGCDDSSVCPPPGSLGGFLPYVSRLSRFVSTDGGATFDRASEQILLDSWQPVDNHTVNQIAFGPDGMLYVGAGDGGCCGDPLTLAQNLTSLRGKILRIDVSGGSAGYAVPPDNPFVGVAGVAPEIWAYGLRNPWKLSFDRVDGTLWVGDVGQDAWEEVNIIEKGKDYGWNEVEGPACYLPGCDLSAHEPPVTWYSHAVGHSVTGGHVYRGSAIPALSGAYLFGDYAYRRVWALYRDGVHADLAPELGGAYPQQALFDLNDGLVSFVEDAAGELYVIESVVYGDAPGVVKKLVPPSAIPSNFPKLLSQTGCFEAADPRVPVPAMIPYAPNAPFWSDGAQKDRYLAVPDGSAITVRGDGDFDFPVGSVLAKVFTLEGKRRETRLFMRHDDGTWAGYTYLFREDESEADLLEGSLDEVIGPVTYHYPSRGECSFCHTKAAGDTLGLEERQLDGPLTYPSGVTANQVETLRHIGILGPASAGEEARYRFDEAAGGVAADAIGGADATLQNGAYFTGTSLYLDGVDDYAVTPVQNAQVRTLAAWIFPRSSDDVPFIESVIDSDIPGQYGTGFGLDAGYFKIILDDLFWEPLVPVTLDAWQHVALVFDGASAQLYVDGGLAASIGYVAGPVTQAAYLIGRSNANDLFFDGEVKDVRIFTEALSAVEVAVIATGGDLLPERLAPYPDPYGVEPMAERARAWLHTNCGSCHRQGGPGGYDLRFATPLAATGMCDVAPAHGDLGLPNARLLAPGDPGRSVLVARIEDTGMLRMPPVSSHVVDQAGTALIEGWIASLGGCN